MHIQYDLKILNVSSQVQKAIAFARKAHQGQFRKTGDPYLTHCIHTAKILAVLVPSTGKRVTNVPIVMLSCIFVLLI